jgi:hypothetical protein
MERRSRLSQVLAATGLLVLVASLALVTSVHYGPISLESWAEVTPHSMLPNVRRAPSEAPLPCFSVARSVRVAPQTAQVAQWTCYHQ